MEADHHYFKPEVHEIPHYIHKITHDTFIDDLRPIFEQHVQLWLFNPENYGGKE